MTRCLLQRFAGAFRLYNFAGAPDDGASAVTAEVVAHVNTAVRFEVMADFQYVSIDSRPPSGQVRTAWQEAQALVDISCS